MANQLSLKERHSNLEKALSEIFGVTVEITMRGQRDFTVSFEGENAVVADKIKKYFESATKKIEVDYDKECDHTAIYFTA